MSIINIHCADKTQHQQLGVQLLFHGKHDCEPGHFWGPGLRDCYILHFVIDGHGQFHTEQESISLTRGQGFLITPHRLVHYEADFANPWSYYWIGFQGLQVKSFLQSAQISEKQPIFNFQNLEFIESLHQALIEAAELVSYDLMFQSLIYRVFSEIIESEYQKHEHLQTGQKLASSHSSSFYIEQAKEWISHHYSQKITTEQIAQHVRLNSSYLSRLFKREYDLSLKEYIIHYRINRSLDLLKNATLTISDVSRSVGYTDPFVFSKIFKRITGKTPSELRKGLD